MAKAFLKWVGGKRQLLGEIKRLMPVGFEHYYEPFVGGGAVFFDLQPKNSHLFDINKELIVTYRQVRDNPEELALRVKFLEERHSKSEYYAIRALDRDLNWSTASELDVASRLLYLNKACFNGLYRVNSKGYFNSPIGTGKPKLNKEGLLEASIALQGVTIAQSSFKDMVSEIQPNSFVYLDPPYAPISSTSNFANYSADGFSLQDQIELVKHVDILTRNDIKVMISNSWCDFTRELYKHLNCHEVKASRVLNSKGSGRGKVSEIIACNY